MKMNTIVARSVVLVILGLLLVGGLGCVSQGVPIDQDPRLQLAPVPSDGWAANDSNRSRIVVILVVILSCALAYAVRDWVRTGNPGMICLIMGAGLTCLIEPFEDMPCAVWYMRSEQSMLFEYFGRPMPLFMPLLYLTAYGTLGVVFYKLFLKGVTRKQMWGMFVVAAIGDIAIEWPLLNMNGTYVYYGNQPFFFKNFAFWMPVLSGFSFLEAPSMAALMTPHLKGWRWLLIPLTMPIGTLALGYSPALTLPAFVAINGNYSWMVTQLFGLCTIGMCLLFTWGLSMFVCTDSPYDLLRPRIQAAGK